MHIHILHYKDCARIVFLPHVFQDTSIRYRGQSSFDAKLWTDIFPIDAAIIVRKR